MPCQQITASLFKTKKPQFSSVDNTVVESYIELAQIWAGGEWPARLCEPVQVAVVCHLMTLDGLGSDARSKNNASGRSEFQTIRTGSVTLTRFRSAAESAGMSTTSWFSQTPCGQQYLVFARMCFSGARWVGGSDPGAVSPYAKDAYRDGWWTC